MTDHASQDKLGSPASFGAFPGALLPLPGPRPRKPLADLVRYSYRWEIEAYALRPRETLEIIEVRDEAERDEVRARLDDKYVELNRSRPVVICSTPIRGSRQEVMT